MHAELFESSPEPACSARASFSVLQATQRQPLGPADARQRDAEVVGEQQQLIHVTYNTREHNATALRAVRRCCQTLSVFVLFNVNQFFL